MILNQCDPYEEERQMAEEALQLYDVQRYNYWFDEHEPQV